MRPIYIWQYDEWPNFTWDAEKIATKLGETHRLQGMLAGKLSMLGFDVKSGALLDAMTEEVVKSSEIEGVLLNIDQVRSSLARQLHLEIEGLPETDRYIDGVVQVMMDATQNYDKPLTAERLFDWHAALFPTGRSGMYKITVANWRQGPEPMQVVSGPMGKERVHYQAPFSEDVPAEMQQFLDWTENENEIDPLIKAAIAHLWFVAIHPFDDGNGRLTRIITESLLARADGQPHRYYSMSATIRRHRKEYYDILEQTTTHGLDVTPWLEWFIGCLQDALNDADKSLQKVVAKTIFWTRHQNEKFNERQLKMINRLWDGIEGVLTSKKWSKMTHCSPDTALRDIKDLISRGILVQAPGGSRNTHYELVK